MSTNFTNNETQKKYNKGRDAARILAGLVYAGVVVAATTLFVSFVLTAFPESAYFSRFIMTVAGVLVGASMIAFPVALHLWAIEKDHRYWTTGLYYGEMAIIAINTIVSFSSLLAKYTGAPVPEWVLLYEPFSILAIVYTLGAWGTVFLLDPAHKSTVKELEALQEFNDMVSGKLKEFVGSIEGRQAIQRAAEKKIERMFDAQNYDTAPQHFVGQPENATGIEEGQGSANGNGRTVDPTNQPRR